MSKLNFHSTVAEPSTEAETTADPAPAATETSEAPTASKNLIAINE